eukprot:m.12697 g.12697  ORF g.12697 m.12697 type:complete len:141 (-) comp2749_c0_seq2:287-709(-)
MYTGARILTAIVSIMCTARILTTAGPGNEARAMAHLESIGWLTERSGVKNTKVPEVLRKCFAGQCKAIAGTDLRHASTGALGSPSAVVIVREEVDLPRGRRVCCLLGLGIHVDTPPNQNGYSMRLWDPAAPRGPFQYSLV